MMVADGDGGDLDSSDGLHALEAVGFVVAAVDGCCR
jgi:hypothetical protein